MTTILQKNHIVLYPNNLVKLTQEGRKFLRNRLSLKFAYTYRDIAIASNTTEGTVKRLYSGKTISINHFSSICKVLSIKLQDQLFIAKTSTKRNVVDKSSSELKLKKTFKDKENSSILEVSWSPNGKAIATGNKNGNIHIWNIFNKRLDKKLKYNTVEDENFYGTVFSIDWSIDGQKIVAGYEDGLLIAWDIYKSKIIKRLTTNINHISSISWSPDSDKVAFASNIENSIYIWDISNDNNSVNRIFEAGADIIKLSWSFGNNYLNFGTSSGEILQLNINSNTHQELAIYNKKTFCLQWSKNHSNFACSFRDGSISIQNLETEELRILIGNNSKASSISFSADNLFIASKSENLKIWHCETGQVVSTIEDIYASDFSRSTLAFHPSKSYLATTIEDDTVLQIFELDVKALLNSIQTKKSVNYINAKVVLLGESRVGKSGLAIRMAERIFRETKSTHGAQFWQIPLPENTLPATSQLNGNVQAEITLWDLAGQPDYHLIHQLFLDDTDIALLLFDCSDPADPFRGVPYWAKVLKKQAPRSTLRYLVSARCDVSQVTVDQKEINRKLVEYELDNYFCTSAFTGKGVDELLQHILNNIPWSKLPRTSTPRLFQLIREYLLNQKEKGKTLLSLDKIKTEVSQMYLEVTVEDEEIETVVNLLQARGFIYFLEPTPNLSLVLLKPELINKYASSIIQAARQKGVGAILERDVVCANLSFCGFDKKERLPATEEKLILESTVELFIRRNLGFREMGRLIFPSQLNSRQEIPTDQHPPTEVVYEFSGSVEAIYTSLVVCLNYTKDFQLEQLWKYAAEFSREGSHLGFAMQQVEGTGELEIYFYEQVSDFDRVTFIRFIKNHLHSKGIDLKESIRLYCPECGEEVKNRKAIKKRVQEGKLQIPCQYCDTFILIPRSIEEKYRSDRAYVQKQQELQATIKERTSQEVIDFREDREQYMGKTDKQIRILHLSDIHLGTSDQAKKYFAQLATDLTQNLKVKQLNYLVLSGDIANYSTIEEYNAAFELVDKLVNRYGLNPDRVITVPGNHDLSWDLSEEAYDFVSKRKLPKTLKEEEYIDAGNLGAFIRDEERYQKRFKHFSDRFYKKVYSRTYPLEYDQQAILHPCPEDKILFLALNSCWELDHHYKDRASINPNAISNAIDQILTRNYDDWLKIAVWHHPVTSSESMKNVAFLEQLAVNRFQVAMHGHIHEAKKENFQYDTDRGIHIIAAGTFGAPIKEQVTGIPLQYNLLVLNPDNGKLTVETRKKEKIDGAWSADARWGNISTNPSPRYTISLEYGSGKQKSDNVVSQHINSRSFSQPHSTNQNPSSQPTTINIKIFLASSSELKKDREQFEIFINRKNKEEYIQNGVFLELVLWEDFLDAMSQTRLQDKYNQAIEECDVCVSLFYSKVGKYTKEEFLKALENFKANDKPLIYTYFKDTQIKMSEIKEDDILRLLNFKKRLKELGHFPNEYTEDISSLKLHFGNQLMKFLPELIKSKNASK